MIFSSLLSVSNPKLNSTTPFLHISICLRIIQEEYLSALTSLMQDPGSPEVKKPAVTEKDSKESTPMVNYSIVIDIKSTVWRQQCFAGLFKPHPAVHKLGVAS